MAATNLISTINRRVREAWSSFYAELRKMGGDARPSQAADIFVFRLSDEGVEVEVRPVTFRLKEKAARKDSSIYVTVTGNLRFSPESTRDDLRARRFATRVGYFREIEDKRLKHVYGIHYDYDDRLPAHPVYHCQIASMAGYVEYINAAHNRQFEAVAKADDYVKGLLGNVRIPTAHMDPFSVFLQIFADHLVTDAKDDRRLAFIRAQEAMSTIRSAPAAAARLASVIDQKCFRSNHWYRDVRHQA